MKYSICIVLVLCITGLSKAQTNPVLGQYFQNMPAYSPAMAGMNDNLEITVGLRQQWAGFEGAPRTFYLGANGVLGAKKRTMVDPRAIPNDTAAMRTSKPGIKHGVGGNLMAMQQGAFKQNEMSLLYAVHVPVAANTYLSLGMSASIYNEKVNTLDAWVKDQVNDQLYLSLLQNGSSNTYLHLNTGLSLYSNRYYISYSMMEATSTFISGNKEVNKDNRSLRHHIVGGYRFLLSDKWELLPNTFVRIDQSKPTFYEGGLRARYNRNMWAGLSYRNDKTVVAMLGMIFNNKIRFGYAFEYTGADISRYNQGSHEIVLGLKLFNQKAESALW